MLPSRWQRTAGHQEPFGNLQVGVVIDECWCSAHSGLIAKKRYETVAGLLPSLLSKGRHTPIDDAMMDDTITTRKRRMVETCNSLFHTLQDIWIINMSLFLICAIIFGILLMHSVYQQIYELIFYRNRGWNFDIDNKFTGSTFDGDSNDPMFVQENRKRVIFERPVMIVTLTFAFICSYYIWFFE